MSTTKPSDYGVWTRKNLPNLTEPQREKLCERLSAMHASCAHLLALATNERLRDVALGVATSERPSSRPVQRSIAPDTREAIIEKLSRLERDRG